MARPPITAVQTIIRRIEVAGIGVKHFTLEEPDGWELPPARPGAHIDLHLPGGLLRTYSLCNGPQDRTRYEIAVKRDGAGRGGSVILHDQVMVGDSIDVSLPRGGAQLQSHWHRIFVAGGIGVTPFLSTISALLHRGDRNFVLHVVARGEPPLMRLLAPLLKDGLAVLHNTAAGRPDLRALIGPPREAVSVSCCGPAAMQAGFDAAVRDWPGAQVHVERFIAPPPVLDPDAGPYTLVLARTNRSFEVPLGLSMLDAIARCGVDVPISCGGGICGACRVTVLEGAPLHHDRFLSPSERQHSLLACVAGCAGGRLVLDL